jgi:hypothetical protein
VIEQIDTPMEEPKIRSGAPREERSRISRQCKEILERLRQGPATNGELVRFALKYTGRISELRQAGYKIKASVRNHETGEVTYVLE